VAILGSSDFDVTQIDTSSIKLSLNGDGNGVPVLRWSIEDVATPFEGELCDCHDYKGDGYHDLSLKFKRRELVNMLGLAAFSGETIPLTITGNLLEEYGGTSIISQDCIRVK
jgi:hypothetical protein